MEIPFNNFKRALREGRPQIGLWSMLCSNYAAEIIAGSGFDWLLLDTEHSPNELPMVHSQLQALVGGTATAVVRPAWNDMVSIKRFLDLGVQTLLLPYVQSAQEAANAVSYTRYPPHGVRGVSLSSRANRFGRIKDYPQRAQDELCVLVQIETRQGLDALEEIAAVEGVDGVFIGPADLSADLGHLGESNHPEVQATILDAIHRIRAAGKAPGILTGIEADAHRWLDAGALFVAVGSDLSLLARHTEALGARFKSRIAERLPTPAAAL
jgi:4-hydroxy-2-oxoheptanedioate aldolase